MYGNFYSKTARDSFKKAMIEEERERNCIPQKRINVNPDSVSVQTHSGFLSSEEKQAIIDELNNLLEMAEVRISEAIALKGDSKSIRNTGYNALFSMARELVFKKHGITGNNKLEAIYADVLGNVMGIGNE